MADVPSPFIGTVDQLPVPRTDVDTSNTDAAPYTEYSINVYYFDNSGLIMMPVSGPPGTPAQAVNWSAPFQKKLVLWQATRLGGWPMLPDPAPANSNEFYEEGRPFFTAPMFLLGANQYTFTVGGYYQYGLYVPLPMDQIYNKFAKVPFDLGTYPGISLKDFKKVFTS